MVLESKTKIRKIGGAFYIHIPSDVVMDSQYPFANEEEIEIKIVDDELIVKKRKNNA